MRKNKTYLFLILCLLSILLMDNNFFKKSFFIITKSYDERFISAYTKNQFSGYCSKEAHGYIKFIKYKFTIKNPPTIINYSDKRVKIPYWIFTKNKKKINDNEVILLNFRDNKKFNFNDYIIKDNFNNQCFYLVRK